MKAKPHATTHDETLHRLRRIAARRADPLPDDIERSAELTAPDDPEASAVQADIADEVTAALGQIGADQRAALVLVDLQGYSIDDAARILGCAPGTVKSRCSRGRARLAVLLQHLKEVN